jgi:exodeoxyribonuclease V
MSDFAPSQAQAQAMRAIEDWFRNRTREQQVFRVFGYAGSGKTTITRHAIDELGLDAMVRGPDGTTSTSGGVLYAAYTGKAALVMTRKGTPASTIHSLIYRVSEATPEEIEAVKKEIAAIKQALPGLQPPARLLEETKLRKLDLRLADIHKPRFVLNDQSLVNDAALIVLDEVSMVGDEMARDLLAFGKPILVLGDPGQLPPIKGEGAFTREAPDVMLTEIHRQAGESAIIRLATMAREGRPIPYGEHDAHVWKMRRSDVGPEQMLRGGQVICGRNATRIQLNLAMKRAAGFEDVLPSGEIRDGAREKIICLRNRGDLGLVNGMFLELEDVRDENEICLSARMNRPGFAGGSNSRDDGAMSRRTRYAPEVRARAVRMVFEHRGEHASEWAAIGRVAPEIGCTAETLRGRVRQAERDRGLRAGTTTDERERIRALEREVRELRQANEILRKASAYFAQAELDRRFKP